MTNNGLEGPFQLVHLLLREGFGIWGLKQEEMDGALSHRLLGKMPGSPSLTVLSAPLALSRALKMKSIFLFAQLL